RAEDVVRHAQREAAGVRAIERDAHGSGQRIELARRLDGRADAEKAELLERQRSRDAQRDRIIGHRPVPSARSTASRRSSGWNGLWRKPCPISSTCDARASLPSDDTTITTGPAAERPTRASMSRPLSFGML